MKKAQVFVRAKATMVIPNSTSSTANVMERWVNADVLDLTQESFNTFVASMLIRHGLVTSIIEDELEGDHIELHVDEFKVGKYLDPEGNKLP